MLIRPPPSACASGIGNPAPMVPPNQALQTGSAISGGSHHRSRYARAAPADPAHPALLQGTGQMLYHRDMGSTRLNDRRRARTARDARCLGGSWLLALCSSWAIPSGNKTVSSMMTDRSSRCVIIRLEQQPDFIAAPGTLEQVPDPRIQPSHFAMGLKTVQTKFSARLGHRVPLLVM